MLFIFNVLLNFIVLKDGFVVYFSGNLLFEVNYIEILWEVRFNKG